MRTVPQAALDLITQAKEVGLRATFRDTLPRFGYHSLTDSQGLTDPTWIDACVYQTGLLRVMIKANVLYTQYVSNINGVWPAWQAAFNTYPGSQPAVDEGYIYYQALTGDIIRYHYSDWAGTNTVVRNMPGAVAIAPIGNRAWALWQRNAGSYEIVSLNLQESSQYTIYGPVTRPRIDAVALNGKEYFYTMDRDEGRVIEIVHVGNSVSGKDSYGVAKSIIPIDAIDDVYGFKLCYASVIDNKAVVTGRLTRTSDDKPMSFDAYAIGPEYFSFGREVFIQGGYNVMGKMLRVGDTLIVSGATQYWTAKATTLFGGAGHSTLETTTSDLALATLVEAEGRSSNLNLDISTALNHPAIAVGSDLVLEMAYNNNWTTLTTCDVAADQLTLSIDGQGRVISGVGKSARRLSQWSPDQGVYIPSQAKSYDAIANMTHVIRATGLWERLVPDDPEDTTMILKDLNKLGVLYSTNRAARGGSMRGSFSYPADANFKPYYGVAINYYRESAAEAAERLSVEVNDLEDDMFGHNGIVAIYSKTEHNGAEGVCLYLWKDSALTKLTSVALAVPASTWHWLMIDFVEGEIRVRYRLASNTAWTEVIAFNYDQTTLPWKRETFGRGAIVVKNIVPSATSWGLGSDDITLGVENNLAFPVSGTLRIDNEDIAYNGRSAFNTADINPGFSSLYQCRYSPRFRYLFSNRTVVAAKIGAYANGAFTGAAACFVQGVSYPTSTPASDRTFYISDFQALADQMWVPTNEEPGYSLHLDDPAYGSWQNQNMFSLFGLTPADGGAIQETDEMDNSGPVSIFYVKPALYLTGRGVNDTAPVTHQKGTAHLVTGKYVCVDMVGSFTQDEDQSMEEALKTIVGLSGGKVSCKALVDQTHTFATAAAFAASYTRKNFIATFDLPALTSDQGVGIAFRGMGGYSISSGWPSAGASGGYYLEVQRVNNAYNLVLYNITSGHVEMENVPIRPTNLNGAATSNVPVGTVKVSVQDSDFSVWLNGRYLHTFHYENFHGEGVAFVARQACSMKIHLSELDDLLADIVVGTRGNGMSVISELLADRHILWRDQPDGSMYFYKTRMGVGAMPDIVIASSRISTDNVVSRMRAEGLKISEILDGDLMYVYGNVFATVNARYANNVLETQKEAQLLIDETWRNSQPRKYALVVHPGLQPGDAAVFNESGTEVDMTIRGQTITVGFSGDNFVCDMQCDVVPSDRE